MLKKKSIWILTWLVLLGLAGGCQKDSTGLSPDFGAAYFPLRIGDYWVYQVTFQNYTTSSPASPRSYQLQQQVSSSYNQNGQEYFLVEESVRPTGQTAWKLQAIHTVYNTGAEVVSQEHNQPVIQLAFPVSSATSWNRNAYNARPDTLLQYLNQGHSFALGSQNFATTVSVVGPNDSTLVNQEKYLRVYARDVGLVYGESTSVTFCQSSPGCVGKVLLSQVPG